MNGVWIIFPYIYQNILLPNYCFFLSLVLVIFCLYSTLWEHNKGSVSLSTSWRRRIQNSSGFLQFDSWNSNGYFLDFVIFHPFNFLFLPLISFLLFIILFWFYSLMLFSFFSQIKLKFPGFCVFTRTRTTNYFIFLLIIKDLVFLLLCS